MKEHIKLAIWILLSLFITATASQQTVTTDIPRCANGQSPIFNTATGKYDCITPVAPTFAVPVGAVLMFDTGTCPSGYTEVTALNGRVPIGTLAANANAGTTGGADTVTPAGTISQPVFTGNALTGHAHELPMQLVSGTSRRYLASTVFGTGTSRAAQGTATGTANTTSAAVALSQSVSAGTPSGSVSQPTFTGAQLDNRSAFIRCIFCRKN